jgi:hypothetical protein
MAIAGPVVRLNEHPVTYVQTRPVHLGRARDGEALKLTIGHDVELTAVGVVDDRGCLRGHPGCGQ